MFHEIISEKPKMLQYYLDRSDIKKVCDKAADALKSVLDLLVTSK